jgi:hypothetical protein
MVGRHTNWAAYLIDNLLRKIRNHVAAFFLAAQRAVEDVLVPTWCQNTMTHDGP